MFKTVISKKKHVPFILIFLIIFIFGCASSKGMSASIMKKIKKSFFESWELDKKITRNLTFKLAKKQPLLGSGEKFVLVDNESNLWLFKDHEPPSAFYSKIEEAVSKWGKLCGLTLPFVHRMKLPINGKMTDGTIQRMIPDMIDLEGFNIADLESAQIAELQRQQILDYFVDNYGSAGDNFLLSTKTGEMYGIDKDSSFDFEFNMEHQKIPRENMASFGGGIYLNIWQLYLGGRIDLDVRAGLLLAKFMSEVDYNLMADIFSPILNEKKTASFGSLAGLTKKKKALFEDFLCFYEHIERRLGKALRIPGKDEVNRYKKWVLQQNESEIKDKAIHLKKICKNKIPEQSNIDAVSSHEAWLLMQDKIFNYIFEGASPEKIGFNAAIRGLRGLRDDSKSIPERLAVTLYILRVNEFFLDGYSYLEKKNYFGSKRVTFHPESIDIDALKNQYSAIMERKTLINMEGEFYYATMLAHISKRQYKKANFYARKAEEKGCVIDEILRKSLKK